MTAGDHGEVRWNRELWQVEGITGQPFWSALPCVYRCVYVCIFAGFHVKRWGLNSLGFELVLLL